MRSCARFTMIRASCLILAATASGQGTFQNLDFEQANVIPTPVNGYGGSVDPALAFPGWTLSASSYAHGLYVLYNNLTLDSPAVDLIGPEFPNYLKIDSLQGSYSAMLQYSHLFGVFTYLSQTGVIPADAKSISIAVSSQAGINVPSLSVNGAFIGLVPIGGGRVAGDISAFAGNTATLMFASVAYATYFDDVQFSPTIIPEPSVLTLSTLGTLFLGRRFLRRWRCRTAFSVSIQTICLLIGRQWRK